MANAPGLLERTIEGALNARLGIASFPEATASISSSTAGPDALVSTWPFRAFLALILSRNIRLSAGVRKCIMRLISDEHSGNVQSSGQIVFVALCSHCIAGCWQVLGFQGPIAACKEPRRSMSCWVVWPCC